jgi:NAD(P) transhydrogenase
MSAHDSDNHFDLVILGVHVVGVSASELVHVGMVAMQLGGTIDAMVDAVFNFPTLGELYKYAAYDGLGRLARRKS